MDLNDMLEKKMQSEITSDNTSVQVNGIDLFLPNQLAIGQSLPDSKTDIVVKSESTTLNFHIYNTNRKVVGHETITTPAGTFDCVVITVDTEIKTLLTKSGTQKLWIAEGVGTVKEESYNKKGKLQSYQELTSFSKE